MVLARPDEWETWSYHCSLRLFTIIRRSSCGPMACWILAQTSSLVTWSLYEMRSIFAVAPYFRYFYSSLELCCEGPWFTSIQKMDVTMERISCILELREILLSIQTGFSLVNAAVVCAILESISGLEPSSIITEPRHLKLVTVSSFCPFTLISVLMPLVWCCLSSVWSSRHWSCRRLW